MIEDFSVGARLNCLMIKLKRRERESGALVWYYVVVAGGCGRGLFALKDLQDWGQRQCHGWSNGNTSLKQR